MSLTIKWHNTMNSFQNFGSQRLNMALLVQQPTKTLQVQQPMQVHQTTETLQVHQTTRRSQDCHFPTETMSQQK